ARAAEACPPATIFLSSEFLTSPGISALFPLHGRIVFGAPLTAAVTLEVSAAGRRASFSITPADCGPLDGGGCFHDYLLVLNTFALDDGPQAVHLAIPGAAGAEAGRTVTVDNSSALGRTAAGAIANHPDQRWIWREGEVDSSHFPIDAAHLAPWFDRPDAPAMVSVMAASSGLDAAEAEALADFVEQGFCTLPGKVEESLLERMNADLDAMLDRGEIQVAGEGEDHRVEQIHEKSSAAREIWTLPSVMKFLRAVFQEEVLPCQTLVFLRGSGQDMHQDTIHLTAFPAGYMCGVWIALEDIEEDAGPLFVYPGSHRLPRLYCDTVGMSKVHDGDWSEFAQKFLPRLADELEAAGCEKQTYLPRRGDILVWHENLTHGGSERNNHALSRRSIVSHYFSAGAAVWYDSSGRCGGTMALEPDGKRHALDSALRVARGVLNGSIGLGNLRTLWRLRKH
ncbi:MAG: hypothetical protein HKN19_03435, partial [Halioglobus sp.]|nr:hypothetical protein [Halioglobus sp.]